jgi:hypothetical protein
LPAIVDHGALGVGDCIVESNDAIFGDFIWHDLG